MRDVNRQLEIELPEDSGYSTIADFVLHRIGRIPAAGESFVEEDSGPEVEALESTRRDAVRVRLTRSA